jgi:DNA polymerase-3 subunit epsilon
MEKKMNWNELRWDDTPALVFDFETTGFSKEDRICEVALYVSRGGDVLRRFHSLVYADVEMSEGASNVHGITEEELEDAPRWEDVFPEIRSFFYMDIPWVSHNLSFDLRMLDYSWPASEWPRDIPTLCTLTYAKKNHPLTKMRRRHKLPDLANVFDVPYTPGEVHNAEYDTKLLSQILPKMTRGRTIADTMTKFSHEWRK